MRGQVALYYAVARRRLLVRTRLRYRHQHGCFGQTVVEFDWLADLTPIGTELKAKRLSARMFAAVDIWDAVRSDRPYRPAWTEQQAREYLASLAGTHLDPNVARVFPEVLDSLELSASSGENAADAEHPPAKCRILVVDDYPPNVELLRRWLSSDGHDAGPKTRMTGRARRFHAQHLQKSST